MIKEAIGLGKTPEEALENAKKALNAPESADIKYETLEVATKKILGLFGKERPYKVKASYEEIEKSAKKKPADKKKEQPVEKAPKPDREAKDKKDKKNDKNDNKPAKQQPKKNEPKKPAKVSAAGFEGAEKYLLSIVSGLGVTDCKATFTEEEDGISIDLESDQDYGVIIGRRGETLDSIQYLVRLYLNKGKENYKRVSINIGNYREKRAATLEEIAKKSAEKVRKYGRNVVLDPMNPYERRIIHTTIQEIEGVESHSVGYDAERKVVVTLADGFKPTHGDGRGKGGRGGRGGRGGNRGGRGQGGDRQKSEQPQRSPRSDLTNASRYGKIEPLKPADRENTEE